MSVRNPGTEQVRRFTISPSGRLIALFPDRAVNGLIIYAFINTAGPLGSARQIEFRAAGSNGVPVAAENLLLTCTLVDLYLSCTRSATVDGPGFGPTASFVQCGQIDGFGNMGQLLGLSDDEVCKRPSDVNPEVLELRAFPLPDTFFCDTVAFASDPVTTTTTTTMVRDQQDYPIP